MTTWHPSIVDFVNLLGLYTYHTLLEVSSVGVTISSLPNIEGGYTLPKLLNLEWAFTELGCL